MKAVTAAQMREIDRRAQEEFGIPEIILMENAGLAVARAARRIFRRRHPSSQVPVLVLAGGGSNGGDGFVAARHLHNWGIPVEVLLFSDPARARGAAATNLEILRRLAGLALRRVDTPEEWMGWRRLGRRPAGIVDALLGTGAAGEVREPIRSGIVWANRQRCPVLAVDLPSGLSADTGTPAGVAIRATATVTCGLPKVGCMKPSARHWTGPVTVADISLPRALR